MKLRLFAMVVACCAMFAHASETQDRAAINAEVNAAFERSDFAAIEARYAHAVSGRGRLASGVFVSGRIVRELDPLAPTGVSVPKGADAYFQPIEDKARAWTARYPKSVIAAIVLSQAYRAHGWAYRGGGYANSVSKEDFARFKEYVDLAQEALLARADTGKADPNWHWQVLEVARLQGWPDEKYFAFADAALDAFPGYYDIYFELSNRLVPQWGGSLEELADFAEHAAERTKATEGRAMYARIYWYVYDMLGAERLKRGELDWPKIRAGFDDMVKRYPDPWNLNFFARIACDAGDQATTRRILALVGDKIEPAAWANRGAYSRCKNLAES
jgi:hypothetical protein